MEIYENTALKQLKRSLENSVEKILSKHASFHDNKTITDTDFHSIVDDIVKSKEITQITKKFLEYHQESENGKNSFMLQLDRPELFNESKLDLIIHQLTQTKSADSKQSALESLVKYPVIDIISKYKWPKLSKLLRDNLVTRMRDVFERSYQIHIKLSSHPEGIIEATANILKTLAIVFISKRISGHVGIIDLRSTQQEQIVRLCNLMLNNFRTIFKSYCTNREKQPETLVQQLLDLLIIHKDYDRTDYIHCFFYLYVLDPNAKWFKLLMHNVISRKTIVNYCYKNQIFLKYILKEIITYANNENDYIIKKNMKHDINLDILKLSCFNHCCSIITILLSYKWGQKLFPVEVQKTETSVQALIIIMLNAIQNLSQQPKLNYKREILIRSVKEIIIKNRYFLYNKDVVHTLIRPFLFKLHDKQRLAEVSRKNSYVFDIINEICTTQDAFFIVFGFSEVTNRSHKKTQQYIRSISLQEPYVMSSFIEKYTKQHHCSATERDNICIARTIIDFATYSIKYQTTNCEKMYKIDDISYELLQCCCNIHSLHTHTMILTQSQKLFHVCLNFYKVLIGKNLISNTMNSLLTYLIMTCNTLYGTDVFLKEDSELLYVLCKHYFFIYDTAINNNKLFTLFFVNVANTIPGSVAITECKKQLITPYLNKIWKLEEDELQFLSGTDKVVQEEIFKYLKFIFTLQFNFNCVQSLLTMETDDESTIVDTDTKPSDLKDLIDETMNNSGPGTLCVYIGLQTVRLLLGNLDILILLENTADLREQVSLLQISAVSLAPEDQPSKSETTLPVVIDECSLLRKNIIDYVQNIGNVKSSKHKNQQHVQSSTISARTRRLHELQKFINDTRNSLHDNNWLLHARKVFRQFCGTHTKEYTFADIVHQVRLTYPNSKNYFTWPENDHLLADLFPEDLIGINIIIRFGKMNKLFQPSTNYEENLHLLLRQAHTFLNLGREKFDGFDWFVGVIFLISGGVNDRCKMIFQYIAQMPCGPYIWPNLALQLSHYKNINYRIHFDHTLNKLIGDLEIFKPALEEAGIAWNFIVKNWMDQTLFNILPWNELCNFLLLTMLYPVDYILFFIVTCAQHLEPKYLEAISTNDITHYHEMTQLTGYRLADHINSLDQLGKQYKNILSK